MINNARLGKALAAAISVETGIVDERFLHAFASVPRECFVGAPPWLIARPSYDCSSGATYVETDDPETLYSNVSIALDSSRQLYNGAPAIVAGWLHALAPRIGDRAFHVGCATGYYTAILSHLVGLTGSVVGVDVEESLVRIAQDTLAACPNISVDVADGLGYDPGTFDVALVSAGVDEIPASWLSSMSSNGRLLVPLAVPLPCRAGHSNLSKAAVFLIERTGERYLARMVGGAIIFTARGSGSREPARRLMRSLQEASPREVQSLRRDLHEQNTTCWLHCDEYCLSRLKVQGEAGSLTASH